MDVSAAEGNYYSNDDFQKLASTAKKRNDQTIFSQLKFGSFSHLSRCYMLVTKVDLVGMFTRVREGNI